MDLFAGRSSWLERTWTESATSTWARFLHDLNLHGGKKKLGDVCLSSIYIAWVAPDPSRQPSWISLLGVLGWSQLAENKQNYRQLASVFSCGIWYTCMYPQLVLNDFFSSSDSDLEHHGDHIGQNSFTSFLRLCRKRKAEEQREVPRVRNLFRTDVWRTGGWFSMTEIVYI